MDANLEIKDLGLFLELIRGIVGSLHCWIVALLDRWIVELLDRRIVELANCCIGLLKSRA